MNKRFGPPPDEPGLDGVQAQALLRILTNQLRQREGDRRRTVTGQSDINRRLNQTNWNVSSGIAHIAGHCLELKKQVALLIELVRTAISLLEANLAVSRTNERNNAKLTEAFIEADFIVVPPDQRLHPGEEGSY